MKKIYYLLFVVTLFFTGIINVYADDYQVNTLIPVDTMATVDTDKFEYKNFFYNSAVDAKGNATIKFEAIQNNTLSRTAVSINVLLFDAEQRNIGYLTYCSDKDVSSEYSGFKVSANQVVAFTINVTGRYFVEGKTPKDVRFIAVRDENRYCQIGGYTKYSGLTMDEINQGVDVETKKSLFPELKSLIDMKIIIIAAIIIVVLIVLSGLINLLKKLPKRSVRRARPVKNQIIDNNDDNNSNSEANKPIDLDSFYNSHNNETDISHSIDVSNDNKKNKNKSKSSAIQDMFSVPEEPKVESPKTDINEGTQAVSVQNLYNSINELPEDNKETDSSVEDLYNSINGSNDTSKKDSSIDDLYESINTDDDDDDDDLDD